MYIVLDMLYSYYWFSGDSKINDPWEIYPNAVLTRKLLYLELQKSNKELDELELKLNTFDPSTIQIDDNLFAEEVRQDYVQYRAAAGLMEPLLVATLSNAVDDNAAPIG